MGYIYSYRHISTELQVRGSTIRFRHTGKGLGLDSPIIPTRTVLPQCMHIHNYPDSRINRTYSHITLRLTAPSMTMSSTILNLSSSSNYRACLLTRSIPLLTPHIPASGRRCAVVPYPIDTSLKAVGDYVNMEHCLFTMIEE